MSDSWTVVNPRDAEIVALLQQWHGEQTELAHATQQLLSQMAARLERLEKETRRIAAALDERSADDIRAQNRKIRRHIPFTFQPRKSGNDI